MRVFLVALIGLLILATAPIAQAAQRYAAPGGSGAECSQGKPCSLNEALAKAKANDEVIITGGAYNLATAAQLSFEATSADVHGDYNGPRPAITASAGGAAISVFAPKSRLSYVDVTYLGEVGYGIGCGMETTVERVRATARSKNDIGLFQAGTCAVRDSVVSAEGAEAVGVLASCEKAVTGRNLTVSAGGAKSVGIRVAYNGIMIGGSCVLDLKNAIVSGDLYDLQTNFAGFGPGNIAVAHSNFDVAKQEPSTTITQGEGNQTAPPLFVDAEKGDFHEAAGSPTIDAGIAGELGPFDLDGNPRVLGIAPDIDAYESLAPLPKALPVVPELKSLRVAPTAFRAAKSGGAVASAGKKAKPKGPVGTTVTYSLSTGGTATVKFSVEQLTTGRKAGKRCVKQTAANKGKAKCTLAKKLSGGFTDEGTTGENHFKFTGRLGSKALKPGKYRLVGSAGGVDKSAAFTITG